MGYFFRKFSVSASDSRRGGGIWRWGNQKTTAPSMAYDLVISRLGALATFEGGRRYVGDELAAVFARHLDALVETDEYLEAGKEVLKAVHGELLPTEPNSQEDIKIRFPDVSVGILPWQRVGCEIGGMRWVLRSRASVTGCALQDDERRTKLWWTFEGIPAIPDPDARPNEHHIACFVKAAAKIAEKTMPLLATAYKKALTDFSEGEFRRTGENIRISVTDSDTEAVAALFDALCLENRGVSDIDSTKAPRLQEAKTGLEELKTFVKDVTGNKEAVTDNTIEVIEANPDFPKVSGILCHPQDEPPQQKTVVGFARRMGIRNGYRLLPSEQKKIYLSEENIRMTSAARRLSGMLAGREARQFDQALMAS
jgi:hypothetical protein